MKNKQINFQTVVLMAGKSTRLMPISFALPKGLISLFNKPASFNLLTGLINKGCSEISFVANASNKSLIEDFAKKAYNNIKVNVEVQTVADGPLTAFCAALKNINLPTLLLLGDTDCDFDFCPDDFLTDWLGVSKVDPNTAHRWCMAQTDEKGIITSLVDKPKTAENTDLALMGLYFFAQPHLLKTALNNTYDKIKGEYQLSSAINFYANFRPFKAKIIKGWRDSGALNTFALAKSQFKTQRYFSVTREDNAVIKKGKTDCVINWLNAVTKTQAAQLIPSLYNSSSDSLCEEFLPQKTLSEIVNYFPLPPDNLRFIYSKLVIYLNKLNSAHLQLSDIPFSEFSFDEGIFKQIMPYFSGKESEFKIKIFKVKKIAEKISANKKHLGIVHYNLHFDNIYYEEQTTSFKFDNPNQKGIIIGDIRVDYALLRLNVVQRLCQIKDRLFSIKEGGIFWYSDAPKNFLDDIFMENGYDLVEIKVLGFFAANLLTLYFDEEQKIAVNIMLADMLKDF